MPFGILSHVFVGYTLCYAAQQRLLSSLNGELAVGEMFFVKIILLAFISLLIVVLCLPNIEQGRKEARSAQAFSIAQRIKAGLLPPDTLDPWGNSFIIEQTTNSIVVTSLGSNKATQAGGYDSDDVSTSMSNPPHRKAMIRTQIQIVGTLVLAAFPWILATVIAIHGKKTRSRKYKILVDSGVK